MEPRLKWNKIILAAKIIPAAKIILFQTWFRATQKIFKSFILTWNHGFIQISPGLSSFLVPLIPRGVLEQLYDVRLHKFSQIL